jgi:hypothetical protein
MCPDQRQHRGAHSEDRRLFDAGQMDALRSAASDLAWLLSRRYAMTSSLKLVGDRYTLKERQRIALSRAACSDQARIRRASSALPWECLAGEDIAIDGFNLLITLEAALGGGLIMRCQDGCFRDLASMHGSYKAVQETDAALDMLGTALESAGVRSALWLLDSPVSNSGRVAQALRAIALERGWNWKVELVFNPDAILRACDKIVVTSDSVILDDAARWVNVAGHLIRSHIPGAWLVDFCPAR